MKYFTFFLLLNLFVCIAYSQKTCEEEFGQDSPCSLCQAALHKYNVNTDFKTSPEDKCLLIPSLSFHFSENKNAIANSTSDDKKKLVGDVINKTCEDTKQCSESFAVTAYKDVDTACRQEILSGSPLGDRAQTTIVNYYTAIPLKAFLCEDKEGNGK
jgi:hypothetical protein